MADQLTLGSLPTKQVPDGHVFCMTCSGSGKLCHEDDSSCVVCAGKGHCSPEDIEAYLKRYPHISAPNPA